MVINAMTIFIQLLQTLWLQNETVELKRIVGMSWLL